MCSPSGGRGDLNNNPDDADDFDKGERTALPRDTVACRSIAGLGRSQIVSIADQSSHGGDKFICPTDDRENGLPSIDSLRKCKQLDLPVLSQLAKKLYILVLATASMVERYFLHFATPRFTTTSLLANADRFYRQLAGLLWLI
jgi:hypothetical protein